MTNIDKLTTNIRKSLMVGCYSRRPNKEPGRQVVSQYVEGRDRRPSRDLRKRGA
jgi:hypothetical protein